MVIFAGSLGHSARFTQDELIYDPLFGWSEQHFAYSGIERMMYGDRYQSSLGHSRRFTGFVIHFEDGRTWHREKSYIPTRDHNTVVMTGYAFVEHTIWNPA